MQPCQHVVHRIEDGGPLGECQLGHRRIDQDAAFDAIHDVEHLADDGIVGAQKMGRGHGYVRLRQRRDHAELAIDLMGGGHKLTWRLLAQHEVAALAVFHFGREKESRVGMAAVELLDFQSTAITGETAAQIAVERRRIEPVALHDRNGVCIKGHFRP